MENAHKVRFKNLVDVATGKPVALEVPNTLVYEGGMLAARETGRQAALLTLSRIRSKKKD